MVNFFQKTFLFCDVDVETTKLLLEKCACKTQIFHKGDEIFTPQTHDPKIGFLVSGKCAVCRKKDDSEDVVLNILEKYDSFGVLAAFSSEDFPTVVRAMNECTVVFLSKQEIFDIILLCPAISINIINFLANRISFLNRRISTFTCTSAESKLASYILSEHLRLGTDKIPFNCKRVATIINVGRASIYRALDSLSSEGVILYDTKKINIKNLGLLERMSK